MKKKIEYWHIPRSDERERCAKCLRVLKKKEPRFKEKEFRGMRWEKVGTCCRVLHDFKSNDSVMLNIYGK